MTEDSPARRLLMDPAVAMSALALVVSIGALFVSIYEAGVQRNQQRAEVWPYVEFGTSFSSEGFAIKLTNKGAGPARIRGMDLAINGTPVTTALDLVAAVAEGAGLDEAPFGYDIVRTARISNAVLAPGETTHAFGVPWTPASHRLFDRPADMTSTLCYCSIFDECFQIELNGAAKPAACEPPVTPYQ